MKKSSIKNLIIASSAVIAGAYVVSRILSSKKNNVVKNIEEEKIDDASAFDNIEDRRYHTLCYIKKKNSTEE